MGKRDSLNSANPVSTAQTRKIGHIKFGILSAEEIQRMSEVEISNPEIYQADGTPTPGGINDLRLGSCDRARICQTCNSDTVVCPGHFGHINLARPVYHINFLEYCVKVLRCVCFHCSAIRADPEEPRLKEIRRTHNLRRKMALLSKLCSTMNRCCAPHDQRGIVQKQQNERAEKKHGCGFFQPKIRKTGVRIQIDFENRDLPEGISDRKFILTAQRCKGIFERISDEDCKMMGFDPQFTRPENFIITKLPVAPPAVRPSVAMDSVMRCEDDLTFQYNQILKANRDLIRQTNRGSPSHIINEFTHLLQHYVFTLMDNDIPNEAASMHKSGKKIKSITARLRGKEGRLRGNLMGKRVDFSARAVITPDPNLDLDQLGVPRSIAINLTFPELVTPLNYWKMKKCIANGPVQHPGAKIIRRPDGVIIDLRFVKRREEVHLEYGYLVERHIQTGDLVLFNRQPSLHRMSIMGHRIRILPYSTFRLNLSVTSPYNADFDGDEMNMHVPQSLETKAEIYSLMAVHNQIVTPQSNKPVMGLVQDSLVGIYLFTNKDTFLGKEQVMNLLLSIPSWDGRMPLPAVCKPVPLWTGKQIVSLIFPNINCIKGHSDDPLNKDDSRVLILNGVLHTGQLDISVVGKGSGGVIHIIQNEHGPLVTNQFLSVSQRVVNRWLQERGFSVGISDTITEQSTLQNIAQTLAAAKVSVENLISQTKAGKLEGQPGKNMMESFEQKANKQLNDARDQAGLFVKECLKRNNRFKAMVKAGSKGKDINILNIVGCVGQQNVEGRRIPFGFKRRALPHYTRDDFGPESRGYVYNSYISGLTPQQLFYHAMAGREGIIDTAVKTSETGYIQRRLIKALEGVMVHYDRTARNSQGSIVQFLYGEDGMAGEKIQDQDIDFMSLSDDMLEAKYNFLTPYRKDRDVKEALMDQLREVYGNSDIPNRIIHDSELTIDLKEEFEDLKQARDQIRDIFKNNVSKKHFPVNITRLIHNARQNYGINIHESKSDLLPYDVINAYKDLVQRLIVVPGTDQVSAEAQSNAVYLFIRILRSYINTKQLIVQERFTKTALGWLVGEIETVFKISQVQTGEMVGVIAAQSLGEPATQMTLNTFHLAGVSAKNVTLGVPRLKEVINVAANIKTPSLTIHLDRDRCDDQNLAREIQAQLEHTTLSHVVSSASIIYDPDPRHTIIDQDKIFVEIAYDLEDDEELKKLSPWVLRFKLNPDKMIDKRLSMEEISDTIKSQYEDMLEAIVTDDNSEDLVLRVRVYEREKSKLMGSNAVAEIDYVKYLKQLQYELMNNLPLKGIAQIKKVFVRKGFLPVVNSKSGALERQNELIIETDGVKLQEVLGVSGVDHRRTVSNDVREMNEVLGIEAVRQSLMNELRAVLMFYGIYVNYRHIATLVDVMTHRGVLMPIQRHGIHKAESGPLLKASFERTVEVLMESGVFADTDHLTGISENVMVGQLAPLGTGCFDLLVDPKKLNQGQSLHGVQQIDEGELVMEDVAEQIGWATPMGEGNSSLPMMTPMAGMTPGLAAYTPHTPMTAGMTPRTPMQASFSPMPSFDSRGKEDPMTYLSAKSPLYNPPSHQIGKSPLYAGMSEQYPTAGGMSPSYSPTNVNLYMNKGAFSNAYSPGGYSHGALTPGGAMTPGSHMYNQGAFTPGSQRPNQSPAYATGYSPAYSPTQSDYDGGSKSPHYRVDTRISRSAASLGYEEIKSSSHTSQPRPDPSESWQPISPAYSPSSPGYNIPTQQRQVNSPAISGASYSPSGVAMSGAPSYNPSSPAYNPVTSPAYNPLNVGRSPVYQPTSPAYGAHLSGTDQRSVGSPAYSDDDFLDDEPQK